MQPTGNYGRPGSGTIYPQSTQGGGVVAGNARSTPPMNQLSQSTPLGTRQGYPAQGGYSMSTSYPQSGSTTGIQNHSPLWQQQSASGTPMMGGGRPISQTQYTQQQQQQYQMQQQQQQQQQQQLLQQQKQQQQFQASQQPQRPGAETERYTIYAAPPAVSNRLNYLTRLPLSTGKLPFSPGFRLVPPPPPAPSLPKAQDKPKSGRGRRETLDKPKEEEDAPRSTAWRIEDELTRKSFSGHVEVTGDGDDLFLLSLDRSTNRFLISKPVVISMRPERRAAERSAAEMAGLKLPTGDVGAEVKPKLDDDTKRKYEDEGQIVNGRIIKRPRVFEDSEWKKEANDEEFGGEAEDQLDDLEQDRFDMELREEILDQERKRAYRQSKLLLNNKTDLNQLDLAEDVDDDSEEELQKVAEEKGERKRGKDADYDDDDDDDDDIEPPAGVIMEDDDDDDVDIETMPLNKGGDVGGINGTGIGHGIKGHDGSASNSNPSGTIMGHRGSVQSSTSLLSQSVIIGQGGNGGMGETGEDRDRIVDERAAKRIRTNSGAVAYPQSSSGTPASSAQSPQTHTSTDTSLAPAARGVVRLGNGAVVDKQMRRKVMQTAILRSIRDVANQRKMMANAITVTFKEIVHGVPEAQHFTAEDKTLFGEALMEICNSRINEQGAKIFQLKSNVSV